MSLNEDVLPVNAAVLVFAVLLAPSIRRQPAPIA